MEIPCCGFTCPVEATLRLVGGKYKAVCKSYSFPCQLPVLF